MQTFEVPVRNEFTGEIRIVEVLSAYVTDAQIEALQHVFEEEGWRKATALVPSAEPSSR